MVVIPPPPHTPRFNIFVIIIIKIHFRAALFLIQMVKDYSIMAEDLSLLTFNIVRNLAELLLLFNSRSCQLVLGAGALQTAKLRTITTTNLVLTSRSLQVIVFLIPYVKKHFSGICLLSFVTSRRFISGPITTIH